MLKLATARDARFDVDDRELQREGNTYTYDTLARSARSAARTRRSSSSTGSDAFAKIDTWHRWTELFDLAHFAVAIRANDEKWFSKGRAPSRRSLAADHAQPPRAARLPAGKIMTFSMTPIAISSTAIRTLAAEGRPSVTSPRSRGRIHPLPQPLCQRATRAGPDTPHEETTTLAKKKLVIAALEDIKAHDIVAIDVRKVTPIFDWIVVASADSARQTKALARHVRDKLKEAGSAIVGTEGEESGEWCWWTRATSSRT
jgi:ribosome silencing factor RsfS/YbeB/iojap